MMGWCPWDCSGLLTTGKVTEDALGVPKSVVLESGLGCRGGMPGAPTSLRNVLTSGSLNCLSITA